LRPSSGTRCPLPLPQLIMIKEYGFLLE
jgi:hypothetical protein